MPWRKEKQDRGKGVERAGGQKKVSEPSMWVWGLAEKVTAEPCGYLGSHLGLDSGFGDK